MVAARQNFPFEFVSCLATTLRGSTPRDLRKKSSAVQAAAGRRCKVYASLATHDNPNERFYKLFNMNEATYYTFKKGNVRFSCSTAIT